MYYDVNLQKLTKYINLYTLTTSINHLLGYLMGKIVTCAVHKGGPGKTMLSVNQAYYAVKRGLNVAFVDFDSQCNGTRQFITDDVSDRCLASSDLFSEDDVLSKDLCFIEHVNGVIEADDFVIDSVNNAKNYRFCVIPANDKLLSIERFPIESADIFVKNLKKLAQNFDLVVCDTPPTKGFGMLAPLMASDYAFSPINPDAFSPDGLQSLFQSIGYIQQEKNQELIFLGLVINRLNRHSPLQKQLALSIQKKLGEQVISQIIPERSAINNSTFLRKPVWYQARSGSSRQAAKEMINAMKILFDKMGLEGVIGYE